MDSWAQEIWKCAHCECAACDCVSDGGKVGMDVFFKNLGQTVLERWKRENFSLDKFPAIARDALEKQPPSKQVKLEKLMREFLLNDEQPNQSHSGFGQPEIIAFEHPKFYIQLLFWMDGTTDIHQHEFSGAFHVMHGSSIHAHYQFDHAQSITPHLRVGDVRMTKIELLEKGRTVPIISGRSCIHSLFHLDTPSVTVVVRTQHDPGTGPQFNYLPPHIALDPEFNDTLTMRRKQLLAVLEESGDPGYAKLVREMIAEMDFERGFYILQNCMGHLQGLGQWDAMLQVFQKKHKTLAAGIAATLDEAVRRDTIKTFRSSVTDPEHRFFLALLMNVPTRTDLLTLVKQRFSKAKPVDTILRWTAELAEVTDQGFAILDACFPEELEVDIQEQSELFIAAMRYFMQGGKGTASALRILSGTQLNSLRAAFLDSSLRVLVA